MDSFRLATAPSPRRALLLGLAAVLAFALLAAAMSAASSAAGEKLGRGKVSVLYVLDSKAGSLQRQGKSGRYTLTLKRAASDAVWFSDRPARRSGTFPSAGIVSGWHGFGFAADPPNAALNFEDRRGDEHAVIVRLTHPRYRERGRELSFTARPVDPAAGGSPDYQPSTADCQPGKPYNRECPTIVTFAFPKNSFLKDGKAKLAHLGCNQSCNHVTYVAKHGKRVAAKGSRWFKGNYLPDLYARPTAYAKQQLRDQRRLVVSARVCVHPPGPQNFCKRHRLVLRVR